jgi:hypothetical protein
VTGGEGDHAPRPGVQPSRLYRRKGPATVSEQLPPTSPDTPAYRPHRPAKPVGEVEPHHTGDGTYDPADMYFTADPPEEPPLAAQPPEPRLDRASALVAALILTALLAMAGWTTAALALTRDPPPARATARPSATAVAPARSAVPPAPSLAEVPCGPAATLARRHGLTGVQSLPAATLDGSEAEPRLKLRCSLSSEQFDLSVDLLRSPDPEAVAEFFEFHRGSAVDGTGGTALPGVGDRAFVTEDGATAGGRATVGVDVTGNHRAMSIVGTTSGGYATADARALLVAMAEAYLTAR